MPGIVKGIIDRVRMGVESMWSSVAETRMEVAAHRRRLFPNVKDKKPAAQDSWLGFGGIPKNILGSDENPDNLVADNEADAAAAISTDDNWGLIS